MKPREYDKQKALKSGNVYFRRLGSSDYTSKHLFINDIRDVNEDGQIIYHLPMDGLRPTTNLGKAIALWQDYIMVGSH